MSLLPCADPLVTEAELLSSIFGEAGKPPRGTLRRMRSEGTLPFYRCGKSLYYRLNASRAVFLAACENAPAPNAGKRPKRNSARGAKLAALP
jgi:hypothetical protein